MRRFVFVTLAILALGFVSLQARPIDDSEQLTGNCGEIKNRNSSAQFGQYLWLEYIVETARPMSTYECPWLSVSVEAWVVNVSGSGSSHTDLFTASVRRQVPVPQEGAWQTNGKHYRNYFWIWSFANGETSSTANVTFRSDEEPSGDPSDEGGGRLEPCTDPEVPCTVPSGSGEGSACPIIIDVNRDGYRLTSLQEGVFFDLDADGTAELVSWTHAFSDEAFLAMDRNGNGRIDDGSELFGNNTPVYLTGARTTASNGFEALKFLEGPTYGSSERNEIIDGRDTAFSRLLLWTDANHNGISEPEELKPIDKVGLQTISTEYRLSRKHDRFGNEFRQRAKATWADGQSFVYDVWLLRRQ